MDKNQIKICSNAKENRIEYFEYSKEDKDWKSLADNNHSPFSYEEFLSASLVQKLHDIYKEVVDCYAHPFGVKIIFVGTDEEFKSLKSIRAKDFSEFDIELERGADDEKSSTENCMMDAAEDSKNIEKSMEEPDAERFDVEDLNRLKSIMKKYQIYKRDKDYRVLAETFFSIIPDAYLGKVANCEIYFTTASLYAMYEDETWVEIGYEDLLWDQVSYGKMDDDYRMVICDSEGNQLGYRSDKKSVEKFYSLLFELKNAKTSGTDEYDQITWEDEEIVLAYMKILIDFLKMGDHDTMAALMKCSEIAEGLSNEELLRHMCQYTMSAHEVSIKSLKNEILELEGMLDADQKKLRLALLCKDLLEILQMATCEVNPLEFQERLIFKWIENKIGIQDHDRFVEMLTLPYALMTDQDNEYMSYGKIAQIVSYAHDEQLDIPWHILDNEKIGLWAYLKWFTEQYLAGETSENVSTILELCEFYALSGFYMALSNFIYNEIYKDIFDETQKKEFLEFVVSRKMQAYAIGVSDLYRLVVDDDEWDTLSDIYNYEVDRRTLGEAIFDFFYGKGDK